MVQVHLRNVPCQFQENRHATGSIVCSGDRERLIGFIGVLVSNVSRVVVSGQNQLSVCAGVWTPTGKEVGERHVVALVCLSRDLVAKRFEVGSDGLAKGR